MSTKDVAIHSIESLPEDASWDDIQERINFIAGVRKGLRELDEGKGIPHHKVREEFEEWLSSQTGPLRPVSISGTSFRTFRNPIGRLR